MQNDSYCLSCQTTWLQLFSSIPHTTYIQRWGKMHNEHAENHILFNPHHLSRCCWYGEWSFTSLTMTSSTSTLWSAARDCITLHTSTRLLSPSSYSPSPTVDSHSSSVRSLCHQAASRCFSCQTVYTRHDSFGPGIQWSHTMSCERWTFHYVTVCSAFNMFIQTGCSAVLIR